MKPRIGLAINVTGFDSQGKQTLEPGVIIMHVNSLAGYWLVRFVAGGELCVHKSRMRAV